MREVHFKPAWWLPTSHFQTIWGGLCRKRQYPSFLNRERVLLPDGDFIDLDWIHSKENTPIVIILHGLEGSVHSTYALGMLRAIHHYGWRGVVMNFRGCSGEHNLLDRSYHSGETGDFAYVVHYLKEREPDVPIAAVGFSLGGNVLLKWLGETGSANPLVAAVGVSVPFELEKSVQRLSKGFSHVYERNFLRSLRKKIKDKFKHRSHSNKMSFCYAELDHIKTLNEFDQKITAPFYGFSSAEDYYTQSSSRQYIPLIKKPTLLLQAKDDPFLVADLLPTDKELPSTVILEVTEKGGHVGFVSGKVPWRPEYWLEKRVPLFLQNFLAGGG